MPAIRGLVVAVSQTYAETLAVCLPRNMRHLVSCHVVTAPGDPCADVARSVPGVHVLETDAFTRPGSNGVVPKFNKGLAVEELLEHMGKHGWIWILDADILLPDSIPFERLHPNKIHGMPRRILDDPGRWHPGFDWKAAPKHVDGSPIGYSQLFHADAPALRDKRPWYDVSFPHAGGGDAAFLAHFGGGDRVMLRAECLHLGKCDVHWHGTSAEAIALQAKYVTENNWQRAMRNHSPEAAARAGELPGRVQVPGYPESTFKLPFEARAEARRKQRAISSPSSPPSA